MKSQRTKHGRPTGRKEKKMMSVKKMIELYITYELSNTTWDMMREMSYHGLISRDNWTKFFDICHDWCFDDDENAVVNCDGKILYRRDEQGYLRKVA